MNPYQNEDHNAKIYVKISYIYPILRLTRLKSKVFSLERLWRDCGSKEILGLKKVVKKFWLEIFGPKKILGSKKF